MDDQLLLELMNAASTLPIYGIILSGHLHWHICYGHWTLNDNSHILGFLNEAGVRRYWGSHSVSAVHLAISLLLLSSSGLSFRLCWYME